LNVLTCTDDLIGLLAVLISKNPDATIAVKVTSDKTVRNNSDFIVRPSVTLSNIIDREKGVPDLIDCLYYFLGNISNRPDLKTNLANLKDSIDICSGVIKNLPTKIIRLKNDSQILRLMSLYKAGNDKFFILVVLPRENFRN